MEFPSLGERCSVAVCQQLDLLPICCFNCQKYFCKAHFQPFDHSCLSHHNPSCKTIEVPSQESYVCSLTTCSSRELVHMPCSFCDSHFCLQHRHQVDHYCSKLEKPAEKMVQTAELVKQIQIKNMGKKSVRGVKTEKLSAKVQLMKLKQNSVGEKELPSEERVYLSVETPSSVQVAVFVSKLWSLGKCIDYIASVSKLANFNNIVGKPHLSLFFPTGDCLSGNNDVTMAKLIDEEVLFNGQTVVIRYID